ncbi:MAG: hypothetical protein EBV07_00545, partial [Proteobacteria bacterium]|nr:hypothetical protein [Pseudomonadota bacterium]
MNQEFSMLENIPKKLLSNIFNSLDEGIILVDLNNKILFLNSYLQNFLEIYNTENLELKDVLKLSKKDQLIDLDLVCPDSEII